MALNCTSCWARLLTNILNPECMIDVFISSVVWSQQSPQYNSPWRGKSWKVCDLINKDGSQGLGRCLALFQKCHNQFSWKHQRSWRLSTCFGCTVQIREDQCRHLNLEKNGLPCSPLSRKMWDKCFAEIHSFENFKWTTAKLLGLGITQEAMGYEQRCAPNWAAIRAAWRGWFWELSLGRVTFTAVAGNRAGWVSPGNQFGDWPWF